MIGFLSSPCLSPARYPAGDFFVVGNEVPLGKQWDNIDMKIHDC